jgi:hypothetical protein
VSDSGDDGTGGAGPDQSKPDVGGAGSGGAGDEPRPSGLRNPAAAVRGVGAAALGAQGVMLLFAIVPLRVIDGGGSTGTALVGALAVLSLVLAGLLRYRWAWWAGSVLPLALIASGFVVHLSLSVLGVLFGLVWLYVLRVRATVLGGGLTRRGTR